jgi:hypothetical protein
MKLKGVFRKLFIGIKLDIQNLFLTRIIIEIYSWLYYHFTTFRNALNLVLSMHIYMK